MARSFVASSSQYCAGTLSRGLPITMACWYYPTQSTVTQVVMGHCNAGGTARITLQFNAATNTVSATAVESGGTSTSATIAVTPASLQDNWNFLCGVFTSTTSRAVYNGITSGSDTATNSGASFNTPVIGARISAGSYGGYFDGRVAHAALWGAALSAADVAKLYNSGIGADPRSVRPDTLVAYWPLLNNDGDQDYWGNAHLAASGTPTYAQHPPVLMRSRPKYVILGSAAPTVGEVTITGTRTIGETITANATPTPGDATLTYQWEKSATGSGSGTDISGETASTLALTYADFGDILDTAAYVRCGVVATKDAVPSVETFSSWLEVSAGGAASVGSPFVSSSIR